MKIRAGTSIIYALLALAVLGQGCERPDELGPYVKQLKEVDKFNAELVKYRYLIKSDQADKAATLAQTIEEYLAQLETFGHTRDKVIMAGHNALKRKLGTSLKKIVEPDFPTFTISALKQIEIIEEGYKFHIRALQKRWDEEPRNGTFDLAWPGVTPHRMDG
mgnify:CR=1 FL=1